jgi:hypothetical protein
VEKNILGQVGNLDRLAQLLLLSKCKIGCHFEKMPQFGFLLIPLAINLVGTSGVQLARKDNW